MRPRPGSRWELVAAAVLFGAGLAGCGGGQVPRRTPGLDGVGAALGADRLGAGTLAAAVPLGADAVVALADGERGVVRRVGDGAGWSFALPARPTAIAAGVAGLAVAIAGEADEAVVAAAGLGALVGGLRGTPGAAVVGLDERGAWRFTRGVGATRWATVRALAATADGWVVGGAFAGTLRVGERLLTADGSADGFWAVLDRDGGVRALGRVGGEAFDAVTGVAVLTDGRVAITGVFTGAAELGARALESPRGDDVGGDGFVAVLAADGEPAWSRTWGGPLEDGAAGVAAVADGELVVAGTVRGEVEVAGRRLSSQGEADGLVVFLDRDGGVRAAFTVGGLDVDSLTAVAASAGGVDAIVAGRFSAALATAAGAVTAPSAEAGFVARVDRDGVRAALAVASDAATVELHLAADQAGWLAATSADAAVSLGGQPLPAGPALWRRAW